MPFLNQFLCLHQPITANLRIAAKIYFPTEMKFCKLVKVTSKVVVPPSQICKPLLASVETDLNSLIVSVHIKNIFCFN